MPDVGEVRYKAVVDNSGIDEDIKQTEKQLDNLDAPVVKTSGNFNKLKKVGKNALKAIGKAFVGLTSAAGAGIAAVSKMGIEYNAQMQSYQTAFTTMLGDAEKATELTDKLKTLAAHTPLAMTDLADASKTLLAFGSTADKLPDQLKRLGDVAQGDAQALGTMATAFGRVQSNGYASLEEINMMIDQGFNPLQIIADKTGESMAEVRKRVSAGSVSFDELNDALVTATESGGQFYNAMENQSKTFEGQMSTLKDNVSALTGTLTEDLFGSLAQNALPKVNEWVDELTTAAQEGGVEGAIEAAGVVLTEAVTELLNGAPQIIETAIQLVEAFLDAIDKSGPEISASAINVVMTLVRGLISVVPDILKTAGMLIMSLVDGIRDNSHEITESALDVAFTLIYGLLDALPDIIEAAADIIEALVGGISSRLPQLLEAGARLIMSLVEGLIRSIPRVVSAVLQLAGNIVTTFFRLDWGQIGRDVVYGIANGLMGAASYLYDKAKSLAKNALNSLKKAFDSHSPSKEAKKIGVTVPQGLEQAFEEDTLAEDAARDLGSRAIAGLTADVNYNIPDVSEYAKDLTSGFSGSYKAGAEITVPLYLDGREVARASAWWTGEQLSWEEM